MRKKSEVGARSNRTFRLSEYEMKCLKEGARNAEMGESESTFFSPNIFFDPKKQSQLKKSTRFLKSN